MSTSPTNPGLSSGPIASNSTAQVAQEESRPQAGPLPSKRGELGFVEGVHTPVAGRFPEGSASVALPARHPADREQSQSDAEAVTTSADPPSSNPNPPPSESITKSKRLFCIFKATKTTYRGVRVVTLSIFATQIAVLAATITGWVLAAKFLKKITAGGERIPTASSSAVFLHILFAVALIAQLFFLERRVYRLRGERYTYLHPGEVLPRFRTNNGSLDSATIAFAPWNRPPLPTYAATLAQSGVGTGDVEDNIIAQPPPPAYGHTRGSTLLLAGYLSATQRADRPRSEHTQPGSRPVSYTSRDEPWQGGQEMDRSAVLEETLHRLEAAPSSRVVS